MCGPSALNSCNSPNATVIYEIDFDKPSLAAFDSHHDWVPGRICRFRQTILAVGGIADRYSLVQLVLKSGQVGHDAACGCRGGHNHTRAAVSFSHAQGTPGSCPGQWPRPSTDVDGCCCCCYSLCVGQTVGGTVTPSPCAFGGTARHSLCLWRGWMMQMMQAAVAREPRCRDASCCRHLVHGYDA